MQSGPAEGEVRAAAESGTGYVPRTRVRAYQDQHTINLSTEFSCLHPLKFYWYDCPLCALWDEFMEVHTESLPKPSIGSFICSLLIAIATGTFGVLLVYFIEPQDRKVASVFCWIALAVLVAAFWDLKFRTSKHRERFLRELRSIYDRYQVGEQALTFDGDKWIHETNAGKYEASWKALTTALEWHNVITWSTRDHITMVPKHVLASIGTPDDATCGKEETLARLRDLALGPLDHGLRFRLGLVDYLLTEVPSLWRRHPFLMSEVHFAGVLWVVMIANGMYKSVGPGVIVGWIAASLLLFVTITAQFWYFAMKYFTASTELRATWESEVSDRGVRISNSQKQLFVAWTIFRKFRETRRAFLLFVGPTKYYIFQSAVLPGISKRASAA
jgi:hypothetical protein